MSLEQLGADQLSTVEVRALGIPLGDTLAGAAISVVWSSIGKCIEDVDGESLRPIGRIEYGPLSAIVRPHLGVSGEDLNALVSVALDELFETPANERQLLDGSIVELFVVDGEPNLHRFRWIYSRPMAA